MITIPYLRNQIDCKASTAAEGQKIYWPKFQLAELVFFRANKFCPSAVVAVLQPICNQFITLRVTLVRTFLDREIRQQQAKQFNYSLRGLLHPNVVYFKDHNLVTVLPKSIILCQMTNVNMIFHVVVSVYRLVKI